MAITSTVKRPNLKFPTLLLMVFFLSFKKHYSQDSHGNMGFTYADIRISGTYLMPHHKKMGHLVSGHYWYPEVSLIKKTDGRKYWHDLFDYPYMGVSFHYNDFAGNPYLGKAFAIYPFILLPQIKGNQHTLSVRFGSGLGYITNPFDRITNHKNVSIATYVNLCIVFGFEWEQQIGQYFKTFQGVHMLHFSNGALKMPNTGINLPSLSVGARYAWPNQADNKGKAEKPGFDQHFYPSVVMAGGAGEIYPVGGEKYPAFSLSTSANYRFSIKRSFALNFDLFYSTSNFVSLERKNITASPLSILRPGVSLSQELVFGRAAFVLLVGHYLYALEDRDGIFYNRVGYRINLNDKMFCNVSLKSHLFRAEYIEWGIGYRFLKSKSQ